MEFAGRRACGEAGAGGGDHGRRTGEKKKRKKEQRDGHMVLF
jgi:hypothetical protein